MSMLALKRFSGSLAAFGFAVLTGISPVHADNDFSFRDVKELDDAVRLESVIYAMTPAAGLSKFESFYILRLVAVALSGNPDLKKHYYKSQTCVSEAFHEALRYTTAPGLILSLRKAHDERVARFRPALDRKIAAAEATRRVMDDYQKLSEAIQRTAAMTAREVPEDVILRKYVQSKLDSFKVSPAGNSGKPGDLVLTFANNTGNIAVQEVVLQIKLMVKGRTEPLLKIDRLPHVFSRELIPGDERTETVSCSPECRKALGNSDVYSEIAVIAINGHPAGDFRYISLSAGYEWDFSSAEQHLKTYREETLPGIRAAMEKTAKDYDAFMKTRK